MDVAVFASVVWLSLTAPLLLSLASLDTFDGDWVLDVVAYLVVAGLVFKFGLWIAMPFAAFGSSLIAGQEQLVAERPWTIGFLLFGILSAIAAILILLIAGPYGETKSHELLIVFVLGFAALGVTFALAVLARRPELQR